ncbi:MAG: hypothetical protein H0X42_01575 [Solirubrobacterales bacterium]|nr:hypothetical protein [Solirubrobacterales bacterium]
MNRVASAVGEGSIAVRLVHEVFAIERLPVVNRRSVVRGIPVFPRLLLVAGVYCAASVIDQNFRLPGTTRPDRPLPDRNGEANNADDHQDQSDGLQIQALDVEMGGEAEDRACRDQEDAACEGHIAGPLEDAAEEIDGQQDQDDHYQDSYDRQDELLVRLCCFFVER